MAAQPVHALLAFPLELLADGAGRHPEGCGDVLLFPAVCFELPGALSPPLAPVELHRLRAHAVSVAPLQPSSQTSVRTFGLRVHVVRRTRRTGSSRRAT